MGDAQVVKPVEDFAQHKSYQDRLNPKCKQCTGRVARTKCLAAQEARPRQRRPHTLCVPAPSNEDPALVEGAPPSPVAGIASLGPCMN